MKKRKSSAPLATFSHEGPQVAAITEFGAMLDMLGIERPLLRSGRALDGDNFDQYLHLSRVADIELCLDGRPIAVLVSVVRYEELVSRSRSTTKN